MPNKKQELIEIARSFSRKVSNPTNRYENMDFFCSAKKEVPVEGSIEASEQLFAFCQEEVEKSVRNYQMEHSPISTLIEERPKLTRQDYAIAQAEAPKSQTEEDLAEEERLKAKLEEKVEEQLPTIEYGKNL